MKTIILFLFLGGGQLTMPTNTDCVEIDGRLLDMSCVAIGGRPWKVVHNIKCLTEAGATFYILEDGSNRVLKLTDGKMIDMANKWRPLLGQSEVHVTVSHNIITLGAFSRGIR